MTALDYFKGIYELLTAIFFLQVYKSLKGTVRMNLYNNKKRR